LSEFSFGEAKLVKNNQDSQIQSTTLCNTSMYFSKKVIRRRNDQNVPWTKTAHK